jgi:ankyrin repeat protein
LDLAEGRDAGVLAALAAFAPRRSVFVGILAKMMLTQRPGLLRAVVEAIKRDPTIIAGRFGGKTLLHYAAGAGRPEVVVLLLTLGMDPNVKDAGYHSPLYTVANECSLDTGPEVVRQLVRAGADVTYDGGANRCTPLHMAARRGHVAIAQALLDLGASPAARDKKGCTPLDRAINCRKRDAADLLRRW